MSDWKGCTLQEVVSILGDGLHGTPKYNNNGEYYFINGNNLSNGKIVIKENTKKTSVEEYNKYKKNLNERTVLVSINGTLGNVALYNNEKCFLGKSACYFNVVETVDKLFVRYVISNKQFQKYINAFANGTTIKNVSLKTMREYPFSLPPLPEQKAIASILSSLDDKIDLLLRQNKTLESMAETLFRQWFIEEAQDDWEKKRLGELVTITRGASPRPIINYIKNGTVPWIKIADATGGNSFYINSTNEFIIKEGVSKSVQVFPGDLILSNSATCGLPFFVELEGCIHDGWLLFRDFSVISKFFIFFFLKQINRELNSVADGSVQNNLNTGILKEYELKVPNKDILKKFDDSAIQVINKMKSNNNQIRSLEKLRNTLLPKLMSGEVRIKHE